MKSGYRLLQFLPLILLVGLFWRPTPAAANRLTAVRTTTARRPAPTVADPSAAASSGAAMAQANTGLPDAEAGLETFAARCTLCHGPRGLGDGPQAAQSINPPAPIGTADYLRTAVPAEMVAVIGNGRMENGMPPFGEANSDPIPEAARRDLVAAIFSLGTPADSVAQGERIYAASCAECHGPDGAGVAEADLSRPDYWDTRSNQDVLAATQAAPDHAFGLGASERQSIVDYLRTFSYGYTDVELLFAPLAEADISGHLENLSGGETGDVAGSIVTLRAFQEFQIMQELTTTVRADGSYAFALTDVPRDWAFIAGVRYKNVDYASDLGQFGPGDSSLTLPLSIFEPTTSDAAIVIDQLHIVLDFVADSSGTLLQVAELYQFSNNTDRVYVGASGDIMAGTVHFALPAGAANIAFDRVLGGFQSFLPADEVIQTETGWADTLPLRPGRGVTNLLVQYELLYDRELTLAHPLNYATNRISLILPERGVRLDEAGGWESQGQQAMGSETVQNYVRAGLPAGSPLNLRLTGRPQGVSGSPALARDQNRELLLGGVVLVVVLAAAGLAWRQWWSQRDDPADWEPAQERETLIQAIADLDDAYAAGQLDEGRYRRDRDRLKADLLDLWDTESDVSGS